jgi:hypothetical protein
MAYVLFDFTFFDDAKPVDSATMIDVVSEDIQVLREQAPAMTTWPFVNTIPSSTSTTYDDAACLYRSPKRRLRTGASPFVVRTLQFSAFVRVSVGTITGTVRAFAVPRFAVPADAPADDFVTAESAGTTSTAGEWLTWNLAVRRTHCIVSEAGFTDDEPSIPWLFTFAGIQAKVSAAGTVYVDEMAIREITPT